MKKFLPLLLAALLAFGLCGCAGSDAPDEPEATQVVGTGQRPVADLRRELFGVEKADGQGIALQRYPAQTVGFQMLRNVLQCQVVRGHGSLADPFRA